MPAPRAVVAVLAAAELAEHARERRERLRYRLRVELDPVDVGRRRSSRRASRPRSSRRAPPRAARGAAARPRACTRSNSSSPIGSHVTSSVAHFDRRPRSAAGSGCRRRSTPPGPTDPTCSAIHADDRPRARADVAAVPARRDADVGRARARAAVDDPSEHAQAVLLARDLIGVVVDAVRRRFVSHGAPPARGTARRGRRAAPAEGRARARRSSFGAPRSCRRRSCPTNCSSSWSGHSSSSAPLGAEQRHAELRPSRRRLRPEHLHHRAVDVGRPPARTEACSRSFR